MVVAEWNHGWNLDRCGKRKNQSDQQANHTITFTCGRVEEEVFPEEGVVPDNLQSFLNLRMTMTLKVPMYNLKNGKKGEEIYPNQEVSTSAIKAVVKECQMYWSIDPASVKWRKGKLRVSSTWSRLAIDLSYYGGQHFLMLINCRPSIFTVGGSLL